jgi:hypothetical protein
LKNDYETQIQHQRNEKDYFFKMHPQSPLTNEQKHDFKKLDYFPVNKELRFEVSINKLETQKIVEMQTSTGQIQHYTDYGTVSFIVGEEKVSLHIYMNEKNPDYYFIPFWDKTVLTKETYGAGRYIELHQIENNKFILDFNAAYNPYCAYNEKWTCPLVPPANRLQVRIEAGEKNFHE